ncbi:alpha/beta hydrolase [Actinoplanes subtropicus]|uniref:alpha/beta hydrolase n=1 Tax=Actinoplanes subtropicus TaxID=543632 RepID=UPI0004C3C67D|nr:alpha/beta hydrolase [Actinoplanes subtropicus]
MPIGYAIPVALIAFCTAVAVIGPRPPHTRPSYWGYWVTFQINEQPFLPLYVLVAISALALAQGDVDSLGGGIVFAVALLTAAGLFALVRRALATGPALRRALAEGGIELTLARRPWAHILLAPFTVRRRDVALVRNLSYGDAGRANLLDVYHRHDRPPGAPVLVFFHGGGFRLGSKNREARALLNHLAAQGWVCVNANYRLAPAAHYPEHHIDGKKVIAWVRAHAAEYGGDPRTIVVSGTSAGAHMASMIALTPNDPAFQPGFEEADTSVAAVVAFSGYYGRLDGPGSSPLDRLGDAPPFLVVHGANDSLSLVEDTRDFVSRLREKSKSPIVYAELPGGQHAFDLFFYLRYSYVIEAVAAFGAGIARRASAVD